MTTRPLVAVRNPVVQHQETGEDVTVPEAIEVHCSAHGVLTDWCSIATRAHLQFKAREHARTEHDGDVDAEGWRL